jgi:hypothetical protein
MEEHKGIYKIAEEDHNKMIKMLASLNYSKVEHSEYVRYADKKIKEVEDAVKQMRRDFDKKTEEFVSVIDEKDRLFKFFLTDIKEKTIPPVEDLNLYIYDETNKGFKKQIVKDK